MVTNIMQGSIREELDEIMKVNGGFLDPAKVVEYAEDPDTSLHTKFIWDDTAAAQQYRLWQARQVIRLEFQVVAGNNGVRREVRAFVSLVDDRRGDEDRGYRGIIEVLSDGDLRVKLLNEAKSEMNIFRRKYGLLSELAKVFAAMDEV